MFVNKQQSQKKYIKQINTTLLSINNLITYRSTQTYNIQNNLIIKMFIFIAQNKQQLPKKIYKTNVVQNN